MKKLPISAVMVIYNEEKVVERAIKSIADLVEEIIIIHDGKCSDNSLKIARKYTKKIFIQKHEGYCDSHRIFGFQKAKNEWILILDADEYLSKELRENISELIKDNVDIYNFSWPILHKDKFHYSMYKSALFKKSKIYFIGSIHEYVKPIDSRVKTIKVELRLIHAPEIDNYSPSVFFKKNFKWAKQQAKQLSQNFSNLKTWNYDKKEWDSPNRNRIKHPIFLGMFLSPIFHISLSFKEAISRRDTFFIWRGMLMGLYFVDLYYNVYRLQHRND